LRVKGVSRFLAEIEVDAANGQVHGRQTPGGGVGFLTVDGHIAELAAVGFDELSDCTNMPPEPQQGSYTLPWCGASTATRVFTMLAGV
jgi:hypothetical protein